MGAGDRLERALHEWRRWRRERQPGPLGAFHRAGGQELLTRDLPLSSEALAIDAGGYQGAWAEAVLARYGCRCLIFEPVPAFSAALRERFGRNDRVAVDEAALCGRSGPIELHEAADGTSAYRSQGAALIAAGRDAAEVIERAAGPIGCLKLNIEGGEYEVLERLEARGLLDRAACYLIQFHEVAKDSADRRARLQRALAQTHAATFDFPFVWERWEKKVG